MFNFPIALLFLLLIIAILYGGTLRSPFVFDDHANIVLNPSVILQDLSLGSFKDIAELSPNKRRILPNLSFALNYYFGGFDVFGYHLVNIIIHMANALCFFLLARTTLSLCPRPVTGAKTYEIAFVAALLWAVHPLQTNSVTYIVQRMTSMATLFCLLSLYSYIKARLAQNGAVRIWLFGAAALFGCMALLSKENSGMLPVIIAGYEFFFLPRQIKTEKNSTRVFIFYTIALLVFICICLLFLGNNPIQAILAKYSSREFTLGQRLLTEPRVIFHYLSLLVLPLPARLNLAYDFPISTGLFMPARTFFAVLGTGAMVLLIPLLYRRDRLTAFALFWFLMNLVIESSVIALEIIFEHRMYMPAMFPILAATAWLFRFTRPAAARTTLLAAAALLAIFTWQRNDVWKTEISLWTDTVNKAPTLARAHVNLGKAYELQGDHATAENLLRRSIEIDAQDSRAHINLGRVLERQNRLPEALEILQQGLNTHSPDRANLHNNLAVVHIRLKNYENAAQHARLAQQANPNMADAYTNHGIALGNLGRHREAAELFRKAALLNPDNGEALVRLGVAYDNLGEIDKALTAFLQSLSKQQTTAKTYYLIGRLHRKLGDFPAAISASKQALLLDPDLVDSYITMGISYEASGQFDKALAAYREAWLKGVDMVTILNEWSVISLQSNQADRALFYLQQAMEFNPDHPETHENMGSAYAMLGLPEEAEKYRRSAKHRGTEKH